MIIKSNKKKITNTFKVKLPNKDGSEYTLEKKHCIKYLEVLIDDTISWNYHFSYTCSRMSRNTGILLKLRHFLPFKQLSQLYYNLIYPYLSYGKNTDSALSLLNFLDLLTVENIFIFRLLQFSHQWHKKQLTSILITTSVRYASDVHTYNTRYASKSNFYKALFRTNTGKTALSALAADHWQKLPHVIKDINLSIFPRKAKQYLLRKK